MGEFAKVGEFDVEEYIAKRLVQHQVQAQLLRQRYQLIEQVVPSGARLYISWYGDARDIDVTISDVENIETLPHKLAEMGIELKKYFDKYDGKFDYYHTLKLGEVDSELRFSALPPGCELVKKHKYVPSTEATTKVIYEVICPDEEEKEE